MGCIVKQSVQKERNETLRLFDSMRKHNYYGKNGFNSGNTQRHEGAKQRFAHTHSAMGHSVLLEPMLKNGKVPDAVCLDCRLGLEVAVSESEVSLVRKRGYYPLELDIRIVRVK